MKEKHRYRTHHLLLAALGGALAALATALLVLWILLGSEGLSLVAAWGVVRTQFIGDYDAGDAADSALEGLVEGLGDRWSYYTDAESYTAQNRRRNNTYVGVGITVSYEDERGLLILAVQRDGPAWKAGLEPGEIIIAADGTDLSGEERTQGVELIMGEAGTAVRLTVLNEEGDSREVEITRAAVENRSVSHELLEGGVGYIRVENFYTHSADQLITAVDELVEQGAKALVFDMRNNGGGYVSELTDMLDHLLPEGPIFRFMEKNGKEEIIRSDEAAVELPMATLVNRNTYSAAEFFGAQIQEMVGGIIVGEETSGKGYAQQAFLLPNGGAVNVSTSRYTTGSGVSLVGTGVTLDGELSLDEEAELALYYGTLEHERDAQLQKALELLEKKGF